MSVSLEKTSHTGRPGSDELVPSRYALRVGEIDVLVVSDGVMPIPAATLATNTDPAGLAAWLDDMFLPPVFDWPVNVGLVRSGGRTVLIDAGLGSGCTHTRARPTRWRGATRWGSMRCSTRRSRSSGGGVG